MTRERDPANSRSQSHTRLLAYALMFSLLASLTNTSAIHANPPGQSRPLPFSSYEVVPIGKVSSTPQTYTLRLIRIKGTMSALRTVPRGVGMIPKEALVFTLTDDTGAIEIFYTGAPGYLGPVNTGLLVEGSLIEVLVAVSYITAPGSDESELSASLRWVERPEN